MKTPYTGSPAVVVSPVLRRVCVGGSGLDNFGVCVHEESCGLSWGILGPLEEQGLRPVKTCVNAQSKS